MEALHLEEYHQNSLKNYKNEQPPLRSRIEWGEQNINRFRGIVTSIFTYTRKLLKQKKEKKRKENPHQRKRPKRSPSP